MTVLLLTDVDHVIFVYLTEASWFEVTHWCGTLFNGDWGSVRHTPHVLICPPNASHALWLKCLHWQEQFSVWQMDDCSVWIMRIFCVRHNPFSYFFLSSCSNILPVISDLHLFLFQQYFFFWFACVCVENNIHDVFEDIFYFQVKQGKCLIHESLIWHLIQWGNLKLS